MLQKERTAPNETTTDDSGANWLSSLARSDELISRPEGGEGQPSPSGRGDKNLKISRKNLIYFIGQLAIMFDTGLNLMTALECLAVQAKNPSFERLIKDIRHTISEGSPLWLAMTRHPRVFTPICVSMVRAGEASGAMGEMLTRLETYLDQQNDIRLRVRSALSYPVGMMILSVGVIIFLLTYVFPKFEAIFEGKEESLPLPTLFFLTLSNLFTHYWYILVPAAVVLIGGVVWCWRQPDVRKHIDPALLKIPLVGEVLMRTSLSRSFHTLALMLEGGIPILDALGMARDVAGNSHFKETWVKVSKEVENGRSFSGPLGSNPFIPPSEVQIISMGDRSGQLATVLAKLSTRYEKEVDFSVKNLIRVIEPSLVVVMGCLVGLIVLSLILPIFAMSRGQM